ncbi:hypothetical protein ACFQVA_04025 [Actinomadura keratinilytica]
MWTITVQSARLTTVVDASGSMAQPVPGRDQSRMDVTKASLIQALSQFTPDDEIGLWEFATHLDGDKDFRKLVETRRLGDRDEKGKAHREKLTAAFGDLTPSRTARRGSTTRPSPPTGRRRTATSAGSSTPW